MVYFSVVTTGGDSIKPSVTVYSQYREATEILHILRSRDYLPCFTQDAENIRRHRPIGMGPPPSRTSHAVLPPLTGSGSGSCSGAKCLPGRPCFSAERKSNDIGGSLPYAILAVAAAFSS